MKKGINLFSISILSFFFFSGCSASSSIGFIQSSNNYPNKLPIKARVYIPQDITNRVFNTQVSTMTCKLWKSEIQVGQGYSSAILSGLKSAVQTVVETTSPITNNSSNNDFDLQVDVKIINERGNINVSESFFSNAISSQYQVSFQINFYNKKGELIYSNSANGNGFDNRDGACPDVAESMRLSVENGLKQVADFIATTVYSSADIKKLVTN